MNFVACDISELKTGAYKKYGNFKLLTAFAESDLDCAKIEGYSHKTVYSCAHSLNASIKRYRMYTIEAFVRNGNVYLIKKNKIKNL